MVYLTSWLLEDLEFGVVHMIPGLERKGHGVLLGNNEM